MAPLAGDLTATTWHTDAVGGHPPQQFRRAARPRAGSAGALGLAVREEGALRALGRHAGGGGVADRGAEREARGAGSLQVAAARRPAAGHRGQHAGLRPGRRGSPSTSPPRRPADGLGRLVRAGWPPRAVAAPGAGRQQSVSEHRRMQPPMRHTCLADQCLAVPHVDPLTMQLKADLLITTRDEEGLQRLGHRGIEAVEHFLQRLLELNCSFRA